MNRRANVSLASIATALLCVLFTLETGRAQTPLTTAFTYQGQVKQNGVPVGPTADLTFTLWDAAGGGNPVGAPVTLNGVPLTNGLFTVPLDFGSAPFSQGERRWLAISVNGTLLSSARQELTAAPYALFTAKPWTTSGANIYYDNGRVGIGTNNPAMPLHVETGGGSGVRAVYARASATSTITFGVEGITESLTDGSAGVFGLANAATGTTYGVIGQCNSPNGYAGYFIGRGYFAGDLGIGTAAPAAKLDVNGTARMTGFKLPTGAAAGRVMTSDASGVGTWQPTQWITDAWGIYYGGANVGIGSCCADAKLLVACAGHDGVRIAGNDTGDTFLEIMNGGGSHYIFDDDSAAHAFTLESAPGRDMVFNTSGSVERMRITQGGNVGIGGDPGAWKLFVNGSAHRQDNSLYWSQTSDARLKRDIEPLQGALDTLLRLRGVTYRWNDPSQHDADESAHMGFIAQEVEPVIPQWVHTDDDGIKSLAPDGVDALVVEALRELRREKDAQLDALRAENGELRARLAALEASVGKLVARETAGKN